MQLRIQSKIRTIKLKTQREVIFLNHENFKTFYFKRTVEFEIFVPGTVDYTDMYMYAYFFLILFEFFFLLNVFLGTCKALLHATLKRKFAEENILKPEICMKNILQRPVYFCLDLDFLLIRSRKPYFCSKSI